MDKGSTEQKENTDTQASVQRSYCSMTGPSFRATETAHHSRIGPERVNARVCVCARAFPSFCTIGWCCSPNPRLPNLSHWCCRFMCPYASMYNVAFELFTSAAARWHQLCVHTNTEHSNGCECVCVCAAFALPVHTHHGMQSGGACTNGYG